jgi:hypothetical protein
MALLPQSPVPYLILFLALLILHHMPEINPALFDPLTRIENACRRASNIMLTALDPPRENEMVLREIQEIREALEAFNAAVETGEMPGFKDDGMRAD